MPLIQAKTGTGTGSAAAAFPSNVTAGNAIVVGVREFATDGTMTVTDTLGNTYTEIGSAVSSPGGNWLRRWYAKNITGGANTVTAAVTALSLTIQVGEMSLFDTTSPLDQASTWATGTSATPTSGNVTTSAFNTTVIGFFLVDGGTIGAAGTGYTLIDPLQSSRLQLMYQENVNASRTLNAVLNISGSFGWGASAVSFKAVPTLRGAVASSPTGFGQSTTGGGRRYRSTHTFEKESGLWLPSNSRQS